MGMYPLHYTGSEPLLDHWALTVVYLHHANSYWQRAVNSLSYSHPHHEVIQRVTSHHIIEHIAYRVVRWPFRSVPNHDLYKGNRAESKDKALFIIKAPWKEQQKSYPIKSKQDVILHYRQDLTPFLPAWDLKCVTLQWPYEVFYHVFIIIF